MKGRFAPSPTGRMHLGNVMCALLSWLSAKSQGGQWLLRIEDLDPQRSKASWAELIKDDLRWLGLTWDEEARQSERSDIYNRHINIIERLGLTYPCYCTRAELQATQAPHESDGRQVYPGTCRPKRFSDKPNTPASRLTTEAGKPLNSQLPSLSSPKIRLIVPDEDISFTDGHYGPQTVNLSTHCGDFILRRADGAWAYQLAVVVDDALMGVTEVVRGRDLLLSTPQQLYLYRLLGLQPPVFCHHPLLLNAAGQRLSKRDHALDMSVLRQHSSARQLVGRLAHVIGLKDDDSPASPEELLPQFSWDRVPLSDLTLSSMSSRCARPCSQ